MPSRAISILLFLAAAPLLLGGLGLLADPRGRQVWRELGQELASIDPAASWWQRSEAAAVVLERHDQRLTRESVVARVLRPRWQAVLARLGVGNETVYVGKDSSLELRAAIDSVVGPGFLDQDAGHAKRGEHREADPRPSLLRFAAELHAQGIALWVVPAPSKVTLYPASFGRNDVAPPLHNASFAELCRELTGAGIKVFDPTEVLLAEIAQGRPGFLKTDSHWHPAAMAAVAEALARRLESELALAPPSRDWRRTAQAWRGRGDLVRLLELEPSTLWPIEEVELAVVSDAAGQLFAPEASAEILLLGDSFTNIFADPSLGWGQSAGFAEQLAYALRRPIDRLAINGGGALGSRQRLETEQRAGRDRLRAKKVVILQFAARELAVGDWPSP